MKTIAIIIISMVMAAKAMAALPPTNFQMTKEGEPQQAVCDTDWSCVVWEDVHEKSFVKYVYTPEDGAKTTDGKPAEWQITCEDGSVHYVPDTQSVYSVCVTGYYKILKLINTANYAGGAAQVTGITSEDLQAMVKSKYVTIDRRHNSSPTVAQYIRFMKKHPGSHLNGLFVSPKEARRRCAKWWKKTGWSSMDACVNENLGFDPSMIVIPHDKDAVPTDIINFCREADEYATEDDKTTCIWD